MIKPGGGKPAAAKYMVPALDKGLEVLELLSQNAQSMSQVEIARALGRNVSEIFRTLSALDHRGYIRRTQAGQYRLTLKLFELSRTHSPYEELLRIALPVMRELSNEVKETCHLSTLRGGEIVVLAQNESPKSVRLSVEVGSSHSPLTTTSGRILLSAMSDDLLADFLRDYTDFRAWPAPRQIAFLEHVTEIRELGFEVATDERHIGGLDVGVLIGTQSSEMKAALTVATLRNQEGPNVDNLGETLKKAAARINNMAGIC